VTLRDTILAFADRCDGESELGGVEAVMILISRDGSGMTRTEVWSALPADVLPEVLTTVANELASGQTEDVGN